ncbi:MAG: amino acid permease [Rhizobiales bacterium]|nr:amino acid permease [Hyphomicrobiales bacterium]
MPNTQNSGANSLANRSPDEKLKRALSLPLVVLYGIGVTVGAGIYVLIGVTAGKAGVYAPFAFMLAAAVVALSAASFAELSCRFPVSAGEAAYVQEGFRSKRLSLVVGLLVITSAIVSSSAISIGAMGYILEFIKGPENLIIAAVVLAMGAVAAWGIMESVTFASLFTIIEVAGLLVIVAAGFYNDPDLVFRLHAVIPPLGDSAPWIAVYGSGLLAFFAFVGFEDIVNLAEETREPRKTLPWAIFLTLAVSTLIYVLVVTVAVLSVPIESLATSRAPLGFVFHSITGMPSIAISTIAIVATLNGVIVQIIMASRVLYGLARQGNVPAMFGKVSPLTRTPLVATATVVGLILILALFFPLQHLAEMTSRVVLTIFALVNVALFLIKRRKSPPPEDAFTVSIWVPVLGFLSCLFVLAGGFLVP